MKQLLIILLAFLATSAFAQKKEKEVKADTIVINKIQLARLTALEQSKNEMIARINKETENEVNKVVWGILAASGVNPDHIDNDSLKLSYAGTKIVITRKRKAN